MQQVRVEDAVGSVLLHDITKIVPGEFKGRAFSKGHLIVEEDIPELLKLGKEHIFVGKIESGQVHENEAAMRIARAVTGQGLMYGEPSEGKVTLKALHDGMCSINKETLLEINMVQDVVVATRNNHKPVRKGDAIAGLRVVPLAIDEARLQQVEELAKNGAVIQVKPFRSFKVGVVTTGNEVYLGRIKDKFGPVLQKKLSDYGCQLLQQVFVPDDTAQITQAIQNLIQDGAEMIFTTGGMSVDPDDVTPVGIRQTGAEIITHGVPVLPGTQLLVAYLNQVPILGLPGGIMFFKTTVLDLVLPMILSEEKISKRDLAKLGMGGLCLHCEICHYPACAFGTGA